MLCYSCTVQQHLYGVLSSRHFAVRPEREALSRISQAPGATACPKGHRGSGAAVVAFLELLAGGFLGLGFFVRALQPTVPGFLFFGACFWL